MSSDEEEDIKRQMAQIPLREKGLSPQLARVSQDAKDRRTSTNFAENFKYVSDSERRSYVDYINKHIVLPQPIDGESPTHLFDVIAEGLVLPKLINQTFPNTIPAKKIITKKDKSKFETNINHEVTIEAAKEIGCTVVNIGAEDLSNKKQHLILGLLWQIIKKALMKNVTASTEALISRLETELGIEMEDNITPEQAIMHWFNYHLKKMNHGRQVSNFTSDISDSENYAVLLRRIAPNEFYQEDLQEIKNEKDPLKRAKLLIAGAKRVLGDSESLFVSPSDIVNSNPRLNLAFAATLFNKHPELEPEKPKDNLPRRRRRRTANEDAFVNCEISVLNDGPPMFKNGKICWDDDKGIFAIKIDNQQVDLRREDLQVIPTGLWDFGLLVTMKKVYKLGTIDLSGKTVYISGIEQEQNLKEAEQFLERCKRFAKNKKNNDDDNAGDV